MIFPTMIRMPSAAAAIWIMVRTPSTGTVSHTSSSMTTSRPSKSSPLCRPWGERTTLFLKAPHYNNPYQRKPSCNNWYHQIIFQMIPLMKWKNIMHLNGNLRGLLETSWWLQVKKRLSLSKMVLVKLSFNRKIHFRRQLLPQVASLALAALETSHNQVKLVFKNKK